MKLFIIATGVFLSISSLWAGNTKRSPLSPEVILQEHERYTAEVDVKGRRSPKGRVYLKFAGRIDCQLKEGSQGALDIFVNRIPVSGAGLVNKPKSYPFSEYDVNWYRGSGRWVLPYYRWDMIAPPQENIHLFVFDITNLLNDEKAAIVIHNIFTTFRESRVILREVELLFHDDFPKVASGEITTARPLSKLREKASGYHSGVEARLGSLDGVGAQPIAPTADFSQDFKVTIGELGEISLTVGTEQYKVESQFGFPGFGWVKVQQKDGWRRFDVDQTRHVLENELVRIERTFHVHPTHLEVRDHLINRTARDLPVGVLNALDVGDPKELSEFRLSGENRPTFWEDSEPSIGMITRMLPLAFVARQESGMGFWVEDDAYRNHLSFLVHESRLYAADDKFYLTPKGEYTFVWRLYPTKDRNYFTVLNTHRHVENVYREVPGLWGFIFPAQAYDAKINDPNALKEFLEQTGITMAGIPTVEEIKNHPKIKQFKTYGNEQIDRIKAGSENPGKMKKLAQSAGLDHVKFIIYTDIHLISVLNNENWLEALKDSAVRDEKGRLVPFSAGQTYCVLPKEGSSAARRFEETIDWYLNGAKLDGIFLDEWPNSRAKVSFAPGHEDGMSALINDQFEIERKFGVIALVAKNFQRRLIKDIKTQHPDTILYANHFDVTSEANRWPIVHFAEPEQYDDPFLKAAQASITPISLNTQRTKSVWLDTTEFLRRGILLTFYSKRLKGDHLLKYVYPITVKENGPGYVIGDDKIVTLVSGEYHLHRAAPLKARIFGAPQGAFRREQGSILDNGVSRIHLKLEEDEIAVITEASSVR